MAPQTESRPSEWESAPDAHLVSLCLARSEGAWRALVARHGRLVYAVARQAGLREDDAADVVQTVFLALLEHLPALRRPGQLRAWLVTTGKRAAWRVAARALPSIPEGEELLSSKPDDASGPAERALEGEERDRIAAAFRLLDQRSRRLLWLLFCDPRQPGYEQVARELEIPRGSIGPQRARALAKLKRLYDQVKRPSPPPAQAP